MSGEPLSGPSSSATPPPGGRGELPGLGIKAVVKITLASLAANPRLGVFVAFSALGCLLAIVLVGIGTFSEISHLTFWSAIAAFVLLIVCAGCAVAVTVVGAAAASPSLANPTWARMVPRLPLPAAQLVDLVRELESIRSAAHSWIASQPRRPRIPRDEVRANVFLPDYAHPVGGSAFTLRIPKGFSVGMEGHPDEEIAFYPGQGLTGLVFLKEDWRIAQTVETAEGRQEFEATYELTRVHEQKLHPELRWIVSFPLTIPEEGSGRRRTAGVLNVDGLKHQLPAEELNQLVAHLTTPVGRFADKFAQLPMVRVTINVEG